MAEEVILDAIARLRVDDGNAVQEIASIVEQVKSELTKLANTRGVNVGEDVVKGIGPATSELGELLFQLQKIISLGPEFQNALSAGKFGKGSEENLRRLIQGTEQLLQLTRQVEAAQNATARGPAQGPIVAERERLRDSRGRFATADRIEQERRDAEEAADRRATAAAPHTLPTSTGIGGAAGVGSFAALDAQIAEIEGRIKRADPGDPDQYAKLNAL